MTYYCSFQFIAPTAATYKVFFTHRRGQTAGRWRADGAVHERAPSAGGEIAPTIGGYAVAERENADTAPVDNQGKKRVLIGYKATTGQQRLCGRLYGFWVEPAATAAPGWDTLARPGGVTEQSLIGETVSNDLLIRTWSSGDRAILISSPSKKAFVEIVVYSEALQDEARFLEAGRSMLAALEARATDR